MFEAVTDDDGGRALGLNLLATMVAASSDVDDLLQLSEVVPGCYHGSELLSSMIQTLEQRLTEMPNLSEPLGYVACLDIDISGLSYHTGKFMQNTKIKTGKIDVSGSQSVTLTKNFYEYEENVRMRRLLAEKLPGLKEALKAWVKPAKKSEDEDDDEEDDDDDDNNRSKKAKKNKRAKRG